MAKKNKKEVKNSKDKTSFMKSFKAELKKVTWPTLKQLVNNTVAVLAIVLITAVIVFVLDFSFESINKYGIDKIKEKVSNSATTESSNSVDETANENEETSEETTDKTAENNENNNEAVTENNIENAE